MRIFATLSIMAAVCLSYIHGQTVIDPECRSLLDLVVVLDGSDSISAGNFNTLKSSIVGLLDKLTLGEDQVKFGLVLYSTSVSATVRFSTDKEQLLKQISTLPHPRQGTNTHLGIGEMNDMFTKRGRPDVPKVGIVITDGISKLPDQTIFQATKAKANGVEMFAVGISNKTDMKELNNIASDLNKVLSVNSYDQLNAGVLSVMKQVCPTTTTSTTTATTHLTTTTEMTTTTKATTKGIPCVSRCVPVLVDDDFEPVVDTDSEIPDSEVDVDLDVDTPDSLAVEKDADDTLSWFGVWRKVFGKSGDDDSFEEDDAKIHSLVFWKKLLGATVGDDRHESSVEYDDAEIINFCRRVFGIVIDDDQDSIHYRHRDPVWKTRSAGFRRRNTGYRTRSYDD